MFLNGRVIRLQVHASHCALKHLRGIFYGGAVCYAHRQQLHPLWVGLLVHTVDRKVIFKHQLVGGQVQGRAVTLGVSLALQGTVVGGEVATFFGRLGDAGTKAALQKPRGRQTSNTLVVVYLGCLCY